MCQLFIDDILKIFKKKINKPTVGVNNNDQPRWPAHIALILLLGRLVPLPAAIPSSDELYRRSDRGPVLVAWYREYNVRLTVSGNDPIGRNASNLKNRRIFHAL